MSLNARRVAAVIASFLGVAALYIMIFEISPGWNKKFIELAPRPVRSFYFDTVFSQTDIECSGCRFRTIYALDMIKRDLYSSSNSYDYDYTPILPFIRNDTYHGYEEPIPLSACMIVLKNNDRELLVKMSQMYRNDLGVLRSCIYNGLYWIENREPSVFDLVYDNIASIPSLAPQLHGIPAPEK